MNALVEKMDMTGIVSEQMILDELDMAEYAGGPIHGPGGIWDTGGASGSGGSGGSGSPSGSGGSGSSGSSGSSSSGDASSSGSGSSGDSSSGSSGSGSSGDSSSGSSGSGSSGDSSSGSSGSGSSGDGGSGSSGSGSSGDSGSGSNGSGNSGGSSNSGSGSDWGEDKPGNSGGSQPKQPATTFQAVTEAEELVVCGEERFCGSEWDVNDRNNVMIWAEEGVYEKVFTDVEVGAYTFSVNYMGDKDTYWGANGQGDLCTITVSEVCDVTVRFDIKTQLVTVEGDAVEMAMATEATQATEAATVESTAATEATVAVEATLAAVEEPAAENTAGGGIWMFAALGLLIALILAVVAMVMGNKKKEEKRKEEKRKQKAREDKLREELAAAKAAAANAAAAGAAAAPAAPRQEVIERTELRDTMPAAAAMAAAAPVAVKQPAVGMRSAVFQALGARKDQQDSYGMTDPALYAQQGVMAIVADGMGGLANGKAVSSALVNTFLGGFRGVMNYDKPQDQLMDLTINANQRINQMLAGAERSGSTLLAVIVRDGRMHFLTVGDSRIYLYRGGALLQLNREHIYQEELAVKAVNRQVHMSQVTEDRQAHSLTSFLGIGNLPHMDRNYEGIRLVEGDRIMLCSDGVFGTLTQEQMEYALSAEDVKESARLMRDMIVEINKPYQDNNTGLILEYLG